MNNRRRQRLATVLGIAVPALLVAAALCLGQGGWMLAKATLAQHLLRDAWQRGIVTGVTTPAWPWADARPAARLRVAALDIDQVVLDNASGEAMAFGPGVVSGDLQDIAHSVIALGGHRDSHLAFTEHLVAGSRIELQDIHGTWHRFEVTGSRIIDSRYQTLALPRHGSGLVLLTCYPFSATQTGGPLRYATTAVRLDA